MVKPILLAASLLGMCAAAPLSTGECFNATIRKEYLLQITTYQPYNPYSPAVNNLERISLSIANPTNENQNAITCTDAKWNSTNQPFPSDAITCSDPTFSYKLTSYTDNSTFSLVINQTFVQGPFTQTILASYNATKSDLNGYACFKEGCNAYYQGVRMPINPSISHPITYTNSHRAAKVVPSSTTSRKTAHPRLASPTNAHLLPSPTPLPGQSGTPPKSQTQKTPLPPPS